MLTRQDTFHAVTSYQSAAQTPGPVGATQRAQPRLSLEVGGDLDPGITRGKEPNEDTISVRRGVIPSLSAQPFVLLTVADGMGGQADGQEASRLAVKSLSNYVSDALRFQQVKPGDLLSLLAAGVRSANQVLYRCNQERYSTMGT